MSTISFPIIHPHVNPMTLISIQDSRRAAIFALGLYILSVGVQPTGSTEVNKTGSLLSDAEYANFFSYLHPPWKAKAWCDLRLRNGCADKLILRRDRFENHGAIPLGHVCADVDGKAVFKSFCSFSHYRCQQRAYYVKRIHCPLPLANGSAMNLPTLHHGASAKLKHLHPKSTRQPTPLSTFNITSEESWSENLPVEVSLKMDQLLKEFVNFLSELKRPKDSSATTVHMDIPMAIRDGTENTLSLKQPESISEELNQGLADLAEQTVKHHPHMEEAKAAALSEAFKMSQLAQLVAKSMEEKLEHKKYLHHASLTRHTPNKGNENSLMTEAPQTPNSSQMQNHRMQTSPSVLCQVISARVCIRLGYMHHWHSSLGIDNTKEFTICDNIGRKHLLSCPLCSVCSFLLSLCDEEWSSRSGTGRELLIVDCKDNMSVYIHPIIASELSQAGIQDSTADVPFYGLSTYAGLGMVFWCSRLARLGCEERRVLTWLETEYSTFPSGGSFEICDNRQWKYPSYCVFKSFQCLQKANTGRDLWNQLPHPLQSYPSLQVFKTVAHQHLRSSPFQKP
uniref:acrosin-binding protein isoform X3 n=1 Tax=Myxine glutinosa TaxID=7769 RepID=UPI00358DE4FB